MRRLPSALLLCAVASLASSCSRSADAAPREDDGKKAPPAAPAPAADAKPAAPECRIDVLAKGDGRIAKDGDKILVNLVVTLAQTHAILLDTHPEGDPQPFPVGDGTFLPVLDQTLRKMRAGDHWKVAVPYQLAWGEKGYPPAGVPPKSDVVFDIEILGFLDIKIDVLKEGSGATPVPGEYVLVHYTGALTDGKEFESTRTKDEPFLVTMGAGQVIQGLDTAIRSMKVGSRVKVAIPWQFGYGALGKPPSIPAKSDLVFDVERLPLPEIRTTEVVRTGTGPLCKPGQHVKVEYTGTLADGTQFDSTKSPGRGPLEVVIGTHGVIAGWEMTLAKMRVGDRWRIVVPWVLGFGAEADRQRKIPAKSDLHFDIEILSAK